MADGITLDRNGTSITLTTDLRVTRTVGRPNSELRPTTAELPTYIDKVRPGEDAFEISGVFQTDSAESDAETLTEDILRPQLGRAGLTLTFDNSLYTLDSYTVVPDGAQAGRISYTAGETGVVRVDTLKLRVVDNS